MRETKLKVKKENNSEAGVMAVARFNLRAKMLKNQSHRGGCLKEPDHQFTILFSPTFPTLTRQNMEDDELEQIRAR